MPRPPNRTASSSSASQTANAGWDAEAATYGVTLRFSESDSIASLLEFAATDLTYEYLEGGGFYNLTCFSYRKGEIRGSFKM